MYNGEVYFDKNGNHIRRMRYYFRPHEYTSRNNFIFKDKLTLKHTQLNGAVFTSQHTGREYTAFISDLDKFIPKMINGVIEGFFTFRNNGGSTGIIPTKFDFEDYTTKLADITNGITIQYGK